MTAHDTSWQKVAGWYHNLVGNEGHYYHTHTVIPGALRLLQLQPESSLLDLGCGQGILAAQAPKVKEYLGVDKAPALIAAARSTIRTSGYRFDVKDVTKPLPLPVGHYSHVACILALQNMEHPSGAILNAAKVLQVGGKLVMVLNHPSFRIPRQSGWGIAERTKQQYRWVNRYLTPMKIPILMHPGERNSPTTWSFHEPLQNYMQLLKKNGFVVTEIEEWSSDKKSLGKAAKMENRARSEIPLFMAIAAQKLG